MKKIINGKMYNTETAKILAEDCASCAANDFNYWWEGLYKKRTGEYFIQGEGGPMSKYAQSMGNDSWGWGYGIKPITTDHAKSWCEKHCSADEYETIFGIVAE